MFLRHAMIEKNVVLMVVLTLITVSIGGIVQIIPLFTIESTVERVDGVRPYTPLEVLGRNIYIREGCYNCHSQQIRPFKDEVERYGHYSLAAESMYDKPFQWGSKRTGPDLARVGGRYSNDWHVAHLVAPRAVVPESIMPAYPFLSERALDYADIAQHLRALRTAGTPYSDEMIANARVDLVAHRADHLAVAQVAALADVDVAAGEFERGVGAHSLHLLDLGRHVGPLTVRRRAGCVRPVRSAAGWPAATPTRRCRRRPARPIQSRSTPALRRLLRWRSWSSPIGAGGQVAGRRSAPACPASAGRRPAHPSR